MSASYGAARFLGGLVAGVGLAVCLVALFFLLQILSHYNSSGAQYVLQFFLAFVISGTVAVLGGQFVISPAHRPRLMPACLLLLGAVVSAGLMAFAPPAPSFLLLLAATVLCGGAWIIGARIGG